MANPQNATGGSLDFAFCSNGNGGFSVSAAALLRSVSAGLLSFGGFTERGPTEFWACKILASVGPRFIGANLCVLCASAVRNLFYRRDAETLRWLGEFWIHGGIQRLKAAPHCQKIRTG